jgi:Coenzyme PQQ synthesis protein D (PqqD)
MEHLIFRSTVSLRDDLLLADLDMGEAAVLSRDGVYYGLNPVATRVWYLLEDKKSMSEIRDLLLKEFAVESNRLTRDLVELIEQLAKLALVEISPEATA